MAQPGRESVPSRSSRTERVHSSQFLESVGRRDVRIVERREDLGVVLESRDTVRVVPERRRQRFDPRLAVGSREHRPPPSARRVGSDPRGHTNGQVASRTMKGCPSCSPTSNTEQKFG
jgi:hypothetical protein